MQLHYGSLGFDALEKNVSYLVQYAASKITLKSSRFYILAQAAILLCANQ